MLTNTENVYGGAVSNPARLGDNHGYRIDGDIACLNAELAIARDAQTARSWALQLWACDAPYEGGALAGFKVAEAPLEPAPLRGSAELVPPQPQHLYTEAFARVPAGNRDYSMVLVLASGQSGAFDRVHDFANYPVRERFVGPRLVGEIRYSVEADSVYLEVERLLNPRSDDNLSGSLALELWALSDPYTGGQFSGHPLGGVEIGALAGQQSVERLERRIAFTPPPAAGRWNAVLMLREWTGVGYLTRDFRNFGPLQQLTITSSAPIVAEPVSPRPAQPVAPPSARAAAAPEPPSAPAPVAVAAPAPSATTLVSIQHATLDQLLQVKGLNKKLAAEIIKARPFRQLDDLMKVRGIGDKLLRKLRAELKL